MNKVKDWPSAILMIVAVTASALTILNSMSFLARYFQEEQAHNQFDYGYAFNVTYRYTESENGGYTYTDEEQSIVKGEYRKLMDRLMIFQSANVTLSNCYLRIGDMNENFGVDIILRNNEGLRYQLLQGEGFSDAPEDCEALIGENLMPYSYVENEQTYIEIGDKPFLVVGILQNETASGMDERVIIQWENLSESFQDNILYYMADRNNNIFLLDTDKNASEALTEWKSIFDGERLCYEDTERENGTGSIDWYYVFIKKTILFVAVLFSACSCLGASAIWMHRRQRELMIRRVFGYSIFDIVVLLIKDYVWTLVIGMLSSYIIFIVFSLCNHTAVSLTNVGILKMLEEYLVGAMALIVCVFSLPVIRLAKERPADAFHK